MKKVRCANGHFYDADRFDSCPICGKCCSETELKLGNSGNPACENEETALLPQSFSVDELASTAWISPDEMRMLWGDDTPVEASSQEPSDQVKPAEGPFQESYEQQEPPEQPREAAVLNQQVDELAPTMWIAPNLDSLSEKTESNEPEPEADSVPFHKEDSPAVGEDDGLEKKEADFCAGEVLNMGESSELQEACDEPDALPRMMQVQAAAVPDTAAEVTQRRTGTPTSAFLPVGWLVGLSGPVKGKIFPFKSGCNRIGTEPKMDIVLPEGLPVDRANHAQIIYEPKRRQFFIQAGNGNGLCYLNRELVFTHEELHAYDQIALGEIEFLFLPLCSELFAWDANTCGE